MSTVSEIIETIKKLPEREKSEFLERLAEVDFEEARDRQIEAVAKADDSILSGRKQWKTSRPDEPSRSMKSSATSKFWPVCGPRL